MRLGEFILRDMEAILQRWEDFASTRTPAADRMSRLSLRNHGPEILRAIVSDLAIAQTPEEQSAKSMGFAQIVVGASHTAAHTHELLRAEGGFSATEAGGDRGLPGPMGSGAHPAVAQQLGRQRGSLL